MHESQLGERKKESEVFQSRIAELDGEMSELLEKYRVAEKTLEETEKRLREEIDEVSAEKDNEITNLKRENDALANEAAQLKGDIVNLAEISTKEKRENESLESDLADLRSDFAKIVAQNEHAKAYTANIEQREREMDKQLKDQHSQVEQLRTEKAAWTAERTLHLDTEPYRMANSNSFRKLKAHGKSKSKAWM
ncbi:hypothetical protein UCRPA7_2934 [Phaeoacremonium minimum UCRPA7]|uniref:Uncharacterized protein n=1 Tax=Phaeoacremonium minimum (strain UCR-PA7) TaxID=1286976 RepID=R8BQD9_PHAM7|nr:hypothetical protein UCRPA7_2934 [Phaeoacremonium minimum UCRPA7]EOO01567.1 hypothetical protein UCRPA7_2934 [Phaeoacremonium minimum UCRPA7]